MRILIVEDDQAIRISLTEILEEDGYTIHSVADGYTALEFLLHVATLPDLIMLDIAMPIMNGFDFRDHQLREERICKVPVIAFSAMRWSEWMKDKLGCDAYLNKPIPLEEMEQVIARFDPRNTGFPLQKADSDDTRRFRKT